MFSLIRTLVLKQGVRTMSCVGSTCSTTSAAAATVAPASFKVPKTSETPLLVVDVISDTVCPWCYIGKRRLEKALKAVKSDVDVRVRWHPYQLNPSAPVFPNSEDKMTMYKAKFGAERLAAIVPYVTSAAAGEGIALKFDGKVGNTLLSHQLIHVAAQHSEALQDRVMDGLFAAYFEANDDITDAAVLRRVGLAAGLDAAAVDLALGDDAVRAQTQQSLRESAAVGQHGVPYLVFTSVNAAGTQQHPLSGAQEPETIVKVLKALGVPTA